MSFEIRHDETHHRFVAPMEHGEAFLSYEPLSGNILDFEHTFTPPLDRHQGIAAAIVLHALAYARREGFRIVPSCPYVHRVLEQHPEYRDLVAR